MRLPNWKTKSTETEIADDPRRMQEAAYQLIVRLSS